MTAFLQFLLGDHPRGDVFLNAYEMSDCTRFVMNRGQAEFVPEQGPVFPVVAKLDPARSAFADGFSQGLEPRLMNIGTLQHAAVAVQYLIRPVSRYLLEAGIYVDERIVLRSGVGDDETFARRLNSLFQ